MSLAGVAVEKQKEFGREGKCWRGMEAYHEVVAGGGGSLEEVSFSLS